MFASCGYATFLLSILGHLAMWAQVQDFTRIPAEWHPVGISLDEHLASWQPAWSLWTPAPPPPTRRPHLVDSRSVLWVKDEKGAGGSQALLPAVRRPTGSTEKAWLPHQTLHVPFCLHVVTSQSQMRKLSRNLLCNWDWNAELLEGVAANQKYQDWRWWWQWDKEKQERP